ncbi:hypothetical protein FB554_1979 [Barrientosiimonas humi]|uniref:Uncharacterized protein n=1 Tax=Barrientosiimonas humi TaxID=999931 RepID=A0A542XDJ5_9MICO|nr:hypothetical protein [Barrientosiimonas humi]TQL33826.1 hypothetical protein FB554_1979 [Barrientosiimonas humi]CAG7573814.1 hypothetical protein BH39T_PBIAJDOK_02454 [Barrientosiimonas humi]
MKIAQTAMHTAFGCALTGEGLLVGPLPEQDAPDPLDPLGPWLGDADLEPMLAVLRPLGWGLTREDDGTPMQVGRVGERPVWGLWHAEPVDGWDAQRNAEALDSLAASVGMTAL